MDRDLFSVIVPVYNSELYINECIKSIIDSNYQNWELLLIDDGSTDKSGTICDQWSQRDSRIKVFHKVNGGVSSARNLGIEKAKGYWLTFVDSDDFISPDFMSRIQEKASCEDADLVFNDFNIIYSNKRELFRTYSWSANKEESFRNYLVHSWPRVAWGAVKKKLITKNDIRYPENLTVFEDFHFMCRCILCSHKVIKISEPLYNYRRTNVSSITNTLTVSRKKHDELWVYEDLFNIFRRINKYEYYASSVYWRILFGKQNLVLDKSMQHEFISFFPEKKNYILSCPLIGLKTTVLMWCLTHHLGIISNCMIRINEKIKCLYTK